MNTKPPLAFLALLALAVAVAPAAAPPGAAPPPSNTIAGTRVVRITWDPGAAPPDVTAALRRLASADVAGAIGSEVLHLSREDVADAAINTSAGDATRDSLVVQIDVGLYAIRQKHPDVRPAAKEYADRLLAKFAELLAQDRSEHAFRRVAQAREQVADAQMELESGMRRLRELQRTMAEKSGRRDASPEIVRSARTKLEDERQRLELELAGIEARQKAVEEWIARTTKTTEDQATSDPVIEELSAALAAQQKVVEVARARFKSGTADSNQVAEAEAKLSEVKVALLDRKTAARRSAAGGDALAALNRELQTLSIDLVDRKARLEHVKKRLSPLEEAAEQINTFELTDAELASARRAYEQAREQLRLAQRSTQDAPRDYLLVTQSHDNPAEPPKGSIVPKQTQK